MLSSATAIEGGPGPDDPLATVAVRQRILSEAAVRLLSPGNEPLVVTLPTDWAPLDIRGFYTGLDVDWIDLSRVSDLTDSVTEAARARSRRRTSSTRRSSRTSSSTPPTSAPPRT